jgi:uncharacterized integral membrane protein (TIGR00698 family)
VTALIEQGQKLFPGLLVASLIALAGQFIAEHYGAPAMLMALLFGIALNFLSEEGRCVEGIAFGARTVLRFGVALLGLRISLGMIGDLGVTVVALVVAGLCLTIGFGLAVARFFGFRYRFAFLSSGAVAICGASAAMAIAAVLPKDERSEERLVFTIVGVTLLSTFAMILYPILMTAAGFDDRTAGIFIGATIHDVAQVVGAGFSISEDAGEVATFVKLLRVAMLAPVVLVAAILIRRSAAQGETEGGRPPLLPSFVVAFLIFAAAKSFGLIPDWVSAIAADLSRWALLTAIASVGLKTSLRQTLKVGLPAIGLLVAETAFLAVFIFAGLKLFGLGAG